MADLSALLPVYSPVHAAGTDLDLTETPLSHVQHSHLSHFPVFEDLTASSHPEKYLLVNDLANFPPRLVTDATFLTAVHSQYILLPVYVSKRVPFLSFAVWYSFYTI